MKKFILILIFSIISTLGIFATITNNCQEIENITTVELHLPAIIKIMNYEDASFFNIRTKNDIEKYIEYDINDSVVSIKLKKGNYNDWNICPEDIYIRVGVPDIEKLKINTSSDLVILDYKKIQLSDHETD